MGLGFANAEIGRSNGAGPAPERTRSENVPTGAASELSDAKAIYDELAACEQLFDEGNVAAARQKLISLESLKPGTEQQWKRAYTLSLKLGDRTRAQLYTESFLRICWNNTAAHLVHARNLMSNYGNWDRVAASLAVVLKNPLQEADFWREVAEIQSAIEDHGGVCTSARKSLALDPTNQDLREILIISLGFFRRTGEVLAECRTLANALLHAEGQQPLRWARLARIAAEAGAVKASKTYIEQAIGCLVEVSYITDFELVRALLLTKQAKRAMPHFNNLLRDNSQNSWLWTVLATTAMQAGSDEIAIEAITHLRALPSADPELILRLDKRKARLLRRQNSRLLRAVRKWL